MFATNIANLRRAAMNIIFDTKDVKMAAITLRNIPDELHRKVKRMQLDYEDNGIRKTLEEIYLELIKIGLEKK